MAFSTTPLMPLASGLAMNAMAFAISIGSMSGSSPKWVGTGMASMAARCSGSMFAVMAVRTLPGAMAFRRTPREPQSGLMRRTQRASAYFVEA